MRLLWVAAQRVPGAAKRGQALVGPRPMPIPEPLFAGLLQAALVAALCAVFRLAAARHGGAPRAMARRAVVVADEMLVGPAVALVLLELPAQTH